MVCGADAGVGSWMPWLEILRIWLRVWPSERKEGSREEKSSLSDQTTIVAVSVANVKGETAPPTPHD